MHNLIHERVEELVDIYYRGIGNGIRVRTENGIKFMAMTVDAKRNFSAQGPLRWLVTYHRKDGSYREYGPMDSTELRVLHSDLFWNGVGEVV